MAESQKVFKTVNPTTEEELAEYSIMEDQQVDKILEQADEAQRSWRTIALDQRSRYLNELAGVLKTHKKEMGELMAREMGKPVQQGEAEIEKCAWGCSYYAEHGPSFLADEPVSREAKSSYVMYEPLGLVLSVMPWNYPFWQVFRFAAGAIMAGNGALIKHAPNTTGCGLAIERMFREAGFPEHLVRTLVVDVEQVPRIIQDSRVQAVTVTGSTRAGQAVASEAALNIKKSVLELGGSDPFIVLSDADLDRSIQTAAKARMLNSGQSCIAAKRFIVAENLFEAFVDGLIEQFSKLNMDDPLTGEADLGPQARGDLRDKLHRQVADSVKMGAKCHMGGAISDDTGYFYPPTVLTNIEPDMPVYNQEVFGPVATVVPFASEEQAVRLANDTPYGLGAAIFSADTERAEKMGRDQIAAGNCFINDFVKSDPRISFGGIKTSGYGRELGKAGIREFTNLKTISVSD